MERPMPELQPSVTRKGRGDSGRRSVLPARDERLAALELAGSEVLVGLTGALEFRRLAGRLHLLLEPVNLETSVSNQEQELQ